MVSCCADAHDAIGSAAATPDRSSPESLSSGHPRRRNRGDRQRHTWHAEQRTQQSGVHPRSTHRGGALSEATAIDALRRAAGRHVGRAGYPGRDDSDDYERIARRQAMPQEHPVTKRITVPARCLSVYSATAPHHRWSVLQRVASACAVRQGSVLGSENGARQPRQPRSAQWPGESRQQGLRRETPCGCCCRPPP